jgi:hypothetical protein
MGCGSGRTAGSVRASRVSCVPQVSVPSAVRSRHRFRHIADRRGIPSDGANAHPPVPVGKTPAGVTPIVGGDGVGEAEPPPQEMFSSSRHVVAASAAIRGLGNTVGSRKESARAYCHDPGRATRGSSPGRRRRYLDSSSGSRGRGSAGQVNAAPQIFAPRPKLLVAQSD